MPRLQMLLPRISGTRARTTALHWPPWPRCDISGFSSALRKASLRSPRMSRPTSTRRMTRSNDPSGQNGYGHRPSLQICWMRFPASFHRTRTSVLISSSGDSRQRRASRSLGYSVGPRNLQDMAQVLARRSQAKRRLTQRAHRRRRARRMRSQVPNTPSRPFRLRLPTMRWTEFRFVSSEGGRLGLSSRARFSRRTRQGSRRRSISC